VRCGGIIEVVLRRMNDASREKSRFYTFRLILIVGHCMCKFNVNDKI
jgi:hypothetical protein